MHECEQVKNKSKKNHYGLLSVLVVFLFAAGMVVGGVLVYTTTSHAIDGLNSQISELYTKSENSNVTSIQYYIDETSLSNLVFV